MSGDENASLLQSAVFEDISEEVVEGLCSRGRVVSFDAGQKLFERGESADELIILQSGVVELLFPVQIMGVSRDVTMEVKQAGDLVAWSSLVKPYRLTVSARCASTGTLTSVSRQELLAFFETDPKTGYLFMRNLAGVIGRRLQAMQTLWAHDLQASAAKRLG